MQGAVGTRRKEKIRSSGEGERGKKRHKACSPPPRAAEPLRSHQPVRKRTSSWLFCVLKGKCQGHSSAGSKHRVAGTSTAFNSFVNIAQPLWRGLWKEELRSIILSPWGGQVLFPLVTGHLRNSHLSSCGCGKSSIPPPPPAGH